MKPCDLDAIDALRAKATRGEWHAKYNGGCGAILGDDGRCVAEDIRPDDMAAICALVNAWPSLAVELHQARLALARIATLLSNNGCECDCMCHPSEHAADCDPCLGCRISAALAAEVAP